MMGVKMTTRCDVTALKLNFPKRDFEPWSSEGESMLASHGCDLITIPTKNGMLEHVVGKRINQKIFIANGFIQSVMNYDDATEKWIGDFGKVHVFRKEKVVLTGNNGTGTIITMDDARKLIKNLKRVVDRD